MHIGSVTTDFKGATEISQKRIIREHMLQCHTKKNTSTHRPSTTDRPLDAALWCRFPSDAPETQWIETSCRDPERKQQESKPTKSREYQTDNQYHYSKKKFIPFPPIHVRVSANHKFKITAGVSAGRMAAAGWLMTQTPWANSCRRTLSACGTGQTATDLVRASTATHSNLLVAQPI